ncbi:MAG: hypothetical protein ACE5JJ_02615 [Nitrospinota bacterium]
MRRATLLLGSVALLLLLAPWAWAGWELQLREERRGRSREARFWVDARYGTRWERQGGRRAVIVRTDRELTYVLQHRRRSYFEQSWAELRKLQERAAEMAKEGGMLERMEEMLKIAPPERRARLKRRLERLRRALKPAEKGKAKVRVRPTGRKKTLHGFAAEEVVVEEGGRTHTFWVSREERLAPLAEALVQMTGKMAEGLRGPLAVGAILQAQQALFREFKGVPIRSEVQIPGQEGRHVQEVTSVRERAFSASDFEPPRGYEEAEFGEWPR